MIRINSDANEVSLAHRMHIALLKAAGYGYCGATPRRRIHLEFVAGLVAGRLRKGQQWLIWNGMRWPAVLPCWLPWHCCTVALCPKRTDPSGDEWEKGPAVPESRRRGGAGTAVCDGKIYLACGIMDGHTSWTVAWFDEFDPAIGEWTELPDTPRAGDHFSAVVSDGQLDLVGGRNTSYHEPDNFMACFDEVVPEADVYNFSTGAWSTLPAKLPVPTAGGELAALDGSIYYFGGETGQELAHSDALRLDTATGEWHPAGSLVTGRHGAGTAGLDGRIHVVAGSGGRGGGPEPDSTEVLDAGL